MVTESATATDERAWTAWPILPICARATVERNWPSRACGRDLVTCANNAARSVISPERRRE